MSSSPRRRAARLLTALAACAGLLLPAASASADDSVGATVVGELVQAYPEHADPAVGDVAEAPLSWIRIAAGESVRVPTEDVHDVPAGSTVSVDVGGSVGDDAAEDGYEPARDVLAADVLDTPATPAPTATGPLSNQVTVAMVVPAGGVRDGMTLGKVVAAVNGPVARFWAQQTGGALRLGVTASSDWITTRSGCQDPNELWDEVAQRVGFTPGAGRHLVVYVSSRPAALPGCSYALGQVGSGMSSGGSLYVRDALPSVLAHELGHNFGLGHSSGLQCDRAVETGACRTSVYRDYYDVMGASWSSVGTLTAAQADRLGVLPVGAQVDLPPGAPAGSYTLAPLAGPGGTRALRLTARDGTTYWLEYRAATGQDSWLGTPDNRFRLDSGVLLHRAGGFPDTSLLLDGTPAPTSGWDGDLQAALPVGTPVVVGGGAFTVTVQALVAGAATVRVEPAPGVAGDALRRAPAPAPAGAVLPGGGADTGARGTTSRVGTGGSGTAPAPAATAGPEEGAHAAPAAAGPEEGAHAAPAAVGGLHEASDSRSAGTPSTPLTLTAAVLAGVLLLGVVGLRRGRRSPRAR